MWKRHKNTPDELEARLRNHRAEARDEFVDGVVNSISASATRRPRASSRLAFAAAISVFILGTFASFGGLSYAASGATGAYHAVKVKSGHLAFHVHKSSAAAQYAPTPKVHKAKHSAAGVAGVQAKLKQAKPAGTLPFTGLSLLSTAVLSLALIGLGVMLRRRERQN
jgi:hypothetical protein